MKKFSLSRAITVLTAIVAFAFPLAAFADEAALVLYSGRSESLVEPVLEMFEDATGISVVAKYGNTAQLALAIQEEGANSPADVFWAQDAGALGALNAEGRFVTLPASISAQVPQELRNPAGTWVATSGRARVLAYAPDRVAAEDLPQSIFDLTDPKWNGRIGWAPTNASFQAFVTSMRVTHGDEKTAAWLKGVKANGAKSYPKNTPIIEALAAGEIDLGLPNHYYLLRFKSKDAAFPVAQTFFAAGDSGNLVNVAGAGVLDSSSNQDAAKQFVEFLLSDKAQEYFTQQVFEYPVVDTVEPNAELISLSDLRAKMPDIDLEDLDDLEATLRLLTDVGLL